MSVPPSDSGSGSLGRSDQIAIGVGVGVGIPTVIVGLLAWCCPRPRKQNLSDQASIPVNSMETPEPKAGPVPLGGFPTGDADNTNSQELQQTPLPSSRPLSDPGTQNLPHSG